MSNINAMIAEAQQIGQSVGIRALHDDEDPVVGEFLAESYHWSDDVRSNDSLGGTAVFLISDPYSSEINEEAITIARNYFGLAHQRYAIVVGDDQGDRGMPEDHATVFFNAEVFGLI